ncbi:hypothetical protein INT47_009684 [Mucor saturninus]|uniref:ATP-dependent DNA helicase n=1 Tax=Mucor saturninus TaxID=64648 RepID=A0A8H7UXK6_9FUNG|nr:hypothetical protein INT47_009684 [Mucor saturninus]
MLSTEKRCASCKLTGHSRRSNAKCPMNPKNTSLFIPQKRTNDAISIEQEYPAESSRSAALRVRVETPQEPELPIEHPQVSLLISPEIHSEEQQQDILAINPVSVPLFCPSCLGTDHRRITSIQCPNNSRHANNTVRTRESGMHNIARLPATIEPTVDNRGRMDIECQFCGASMWIKEKCQSSSLSNPTFTMCCGQGKYVLPQLEPTPAGIAELLNNTTPAGKDFFSKIRSYNSTMSFTSLGAKIDHSVGNNIGGAYSFRIHGTICHKIGSILPMSERELARPQFAQIYIYDPASQIEQRHRNAPNLERDVLEKIQAVLMDINPFVSLFRTMDQVSRQNPNIQDLTLRLVAEGPQDHRRYNAPTAEEVAVLIMNNEPGTSRDIVLHTQTNFHQKIDEYHRSYDALHYVLLFPFGEDGWTINSKSLAGNNMTVMQWYSGRLMYRPNSHHHLHLFGRLFQQYIVDMYAKLEHNRLNYIMSNQDRLRVDLYSGVQDAINLNDNDLANLGRRVILPSSFIGSPRHMRQLYQDAMSIVRHFGKPDLFVTFTCNPTWPEISSALLAGQKANDRPDLCSRVFNLKLKELMNDLTKNHILGKVKAFIYVIEFQKRGLPHAHILLILHTEDKPTSVEDYDHIVSAELPDPQTEPQAYATVHRNMMHGPCGPTHPNARCMENGKCQKRYPKMFNEETVEDGTGYPVYRRRQNGRSVKKGPIELDNRWVVPHNRYLCAKYHAHINIEISTSISAVKYLYKYVYKGHDRAMAAVRSSGQQQPQQQQQQVEQTDEVAEFLDARYVSASEASWRIFSFKLHKEYPAHQRLAIHTENAQQVYYHDSDDIAQLSSINTNTTLTSWFDYNVVNEEARQYLYTEFPTYFVWVKKGKTWSPRKRSEKGTISRVYAVSPRDVEKYCLRILLHNVCGATSFADIRTVNGHLYESNQAACRALGLLLDDNEWSACMEEAASYQIPSSLRRLFAVLLVFCEVSDPFVLWMSHRTSMIEDYLHLARTNEADPSLEPTQDMYDRCLWDIETHLSVNSLTLTSFTGFILPPMPQNLTPLPNRQSSQPIIQEQQQLCDDARLLPCPDNFPYNEDQCLVYDTILEAVDASQIAPRLFFVDGPGGTGKTFVFNALLQKVRQTGKIALAVATSGIAALLLDGGRTAHSRFKIPIDVDTHSICSISANSQLAELIRLTELVIWDEASMISKDIFNAVSRSIQDIMKAVDPLLEHVPFGGKLFVFGGDFRQVLPVIPRASRSQIVFQCISRASAWRHVKTLKLRRNMRIAQANTPEDAMQLKNFAAFLLQVGSGVVPTTGGSDTVPIPPTMLIPGRNITHLASAVFPNLSPDSATPQFLMGRAILTPKNTEVSRLNNLIIDQFPGELKEYKSVDQGTNEDDLLAYPIELLNSLDPGSLPPHNLRLKKGCPIMLLRNLDPKNGLCNGTRLICSHLGRYVIKAMIVTGSNAGKQVLIPKIKLNPSGSNASIEFQRYQFPVRLAFAMTINKSQGQTLDSVGLYLPSPVFGHGQLYVALSRVRNPSGIKIMLDTPYDPNTPQTTTFTTNVVYKEVFTRH